MALYCELPPSLDFLAKSRWLLTGANKLFDVISPIDGRPLASVMNSVVDDWQQAVSTAENVQRYWRQQDQQQKALLMRKWREALLNIKDDLAQLIHLECGKPLAEALAEVHYAADYLRFYADEATRINGVMAHAANQEHKVLIVRESVGVVAAITPWNFPLAMLARKVAPAIAAGCSVICKPAPQTPLTALLFEQLAIQSNIPVGLFQVLPADELGTPELGRFLCDDKRIKKISFTGSTKVGKQLMRDSASTLKRLSLELGGNAPAIVLEGADLIAAAEGIVTAKFRNAGQTCISINRLLVHESVFDAFISKLISKIETLNIGPLIDKKTLARVQNLYHQGLAAGGKEIPLNCQTMGHLDGFYMEPKLIVQVDPHNPLWNTEIFGPILSVSTFKNLSAAIALANNVSAGLAAYVYGPNMDKGWAIAEQLEVGMVGINTTSISNASAPFGGVKESGFGREGGSLGIDDYLQVKTLTFCPC